jgi:hypothetical protein
LILSASCCFCSSTLKMVTPKWRFIKLRGIKSQTQKYYYTWSYIEVLRERMKRFSQDNRLILYSYRSKSEIGKLPNTKQEYQPFDSDVRICYTYAGNFTYFF